jgi:ATP-dependent helicase HrpB
MAERWARQAPESNVVGGELSAGAILALAFPDRVARNRGNGSFVLMNGRGASVDASSSLAKVPFVTVGELTGTAASSRILLAAPTSLIEIETQFADQIVDDDEVSFERASGSLRGRRKRRLGAMTLFEQTMRLEPDAATDRALIDGILSVGIDRLPWSKALQQWCDRVMFLRKAEGDEWPDLSEVALAASSTDWLESVVSGKLSLASVAAGALSDAVMNLLPWDKRARLEREAPTHFEAPTGTVVPIDYEAEQGPTVAVRVQELFGLSQHPSIAQGRVPLVLELLSPAQRPIQITRDLPGFWRGSYAGVRTDLRGRYPRHPWPEDPANALPTRRVKPRGT